MAQRLEKSAAGPKELTRDDMQGMLAKFAELKADATEANGRVGELAKNKIELHGLDRKALTMTRQMASMESNKRQATIRAFVKYITLAGFLDQTDAFDDLGTFVAQSLEGKAAPGGGGVAGEKAPAATRKSSATVAKLVTKASRKAATPETPETQSSAAEPTTDFA